MPDLEKSENDVSNNIDTLVCQKKHLIQLFGYNVLEFTESSDTPDFIYKTFEQQTKVYLEKYPELKCFADRCLHSLNYLVKFKETLNEYYEKENEELGHTEEEIIEICDLAKDLREKANHLYDIGNRHRHTHTNVKCKCCKHHKHNHESEK